MEAREAALRDTEDNKLFHLRFTHETEFERLIRPQGTHLTVQGDDSTYLFRLQRFTSVPGISANSMALEIPEDLPELSVEEFLKILVAAE